MCQFGAGQELEPYALAGHRALATTAAAGAGPADLYLAAIQLGGLAAGFAAELSRAEASEPAAARAA